MTKYKFTLSIGYAGAKHEAEFSVFEMCYTEDGWEKLSDEERDKVLSDTWNDWSSNYIDGGWFKLEE